MTRRPVRRIDLGPDGTPDPCLLYYEPNPADISAVLWPGARQHQAALLGVTTHDPPEPGGPDPARADFCLGALSRRLFRNHDVAFDHLRRAVELEDNLDYDEPWGWMQPTRHALGALLLEQGHAGEAEAVYRADLGLDDTLSRATQHPNNLWSLFGLHESLVAQGRGDEATTVRLQLDLAMARADVPIAASCACHQAAIDALATAGDGGCCG